MTTIEPKSISEADIVGLTKNQVLEAVNGLGHDIPCPTCGGTNHFIASADGETCILASNLVSPVHKGRSIWFYALVCMQCGNTKLIEATAVANHAREAAEHADG